jgi:hypothetical protein
MLDSFIIFSVAVYGLTFLIADAKIFGVSACDFPVEPTEADFTAAILDGQIPIRHVVLRIRFFREMLSCYFCTGVWTSVALNLLFNWYAQLNPTWRDSYFLAGPLDPQSLIGSSVIAFCVGAPMCYVINLLVIKAETGSQYPAGPLGDL